MRRKQAERKMFRPIAAMLVSALVFAQIGGQPVRKHITEHLVYAGGFARAGSRGIYSFRFNVDTGKLTPLGLAAETSNPSYFAADPNGRFLYATENQPDVTGAVKSFTVDRGTGKLTPLNRVSSHGVTPCFVSVSHSATYLLVANYSSGTVAMFPLHPDGRIGEMSGFAQHTGSSVNRERQESPHPHSFNPSPDDRFGFAPDLGTDQIFVYRIQPNGFAANSPAFIALPPGSGPRHFTFHPSRPYAYVIEELASSITAFRYDAAAGSLRPLQSISTLPADFHGNNTTADIHVHPSGKFLYGSNRGHDSIAVFAIGNGNAGEKLAPVESAPSGGKTPRIFALDPTGSFLIAANEGSGSLVVFRIDQNTGRLKQTGERAEVPAPSCVMFLP